MKKMNLFNFFYRIVKEQRCIQITWKPVKKLKLYNANDKCKIVDFRSLDNPFIIPFLFNCQSDNKYLISTAVATGLQENPTFLFDISALANWSDLYTNTMVLEDDWLRASTINETD